LYLKHGGEGEKVVQIGFRIVQEQHEEMNLDFLY
jgi:hypothetical protein